MREKEQIVENWLPRYTGVPLDGYWRTVERTGALHPTLQRRFVTDAQGSVAAHGDVKALDAVRLLQHDSLFGERHAGTYCAQTP